MSGTGKRRLPRAADGPRQIVGFLAEVTAFAGELTAMVENYAREVADDRICGSWIARQGNRCLLVRKTDSGYRAVVCDTSRLYKIIESEFGIVRYRGKLCLADNGAPIAGEYVKLDDAAGELSLGSYGVFDTEENILCALAWYDQTVTDNYGDE